MRKTVVTASLLFVMLAAVAAALICSAPVLGEAPRDVYSGLSSSLRDYDEAFEAIRDGALEGEMIIDRAVSIAGSTYNITCVSMGNPHAVVFTDLVDALDLEKLGPQFETNELFPERVNTEFIKVIDEHTLKMRVWERGSGETLACGPGACAAAVAACLNGFCKKGEDIKVILRGGELIIRYTDEAVYMTGNCEKVFTGSIEI